MKPGFFADVTIFDAATIIDHAIYTKPDQLSTGIDYVIVNGQLEYDEGNSPASPPGVPFEAMGIARPTTDGTARMPLAR